jgi:hypothetical protein
MSDGVLVDDAGWNGRVPNFNFDRWYSIGRRVPTVTESARAEARAYNARRSEIDYVAQRQKHIAELLKRRRNGQ